MWQQADRTEAKAQDQPAARPDVDMSNPEIARIPFRSGPAAGGPGGIHGKPMRLPDRREPEKLSSSGLYSVGLERNFSQDLQDHKTDIPVSSVVPADLLAKMNNGEKVKLPGDIQAYYDKEFSCYSFQLGEAVNS